MPAKLKVFRTMTGFHDAYVATPSRAAALRAWGATTDLFAMGAAEQVTDPKLMAAALAHPGEVILQSRGSDAEHIAAGGPAERSGGKSPPVKKVKPRPSRAKLDRAEKRLKDLDAGRAAETAAFAQESANLRTREAAARRAYEAERSKLGADRQCEADAHEEALLKWRSN